LIDEHASNAAKCIESFLCNAPSIIKDVINQEQESKQFPVEPLSVPWIGLYWFSCELLLTVASVSSIRHVNHDYVAKLTSMHFVQFVKQEQESEMSTMFPTDVSNQLSNEVSGLVNEKRPTPKTLKMRQDALRDLNLLVKKKVSHQYSVQLFGSCASGLSLETSDLDLCIVEPQTMNLPEISKFEAAAVLKKVRKALFSSRMYTNVMSILHARVPIVKFQMVDAKGQLAGLEADIKVGNWLSDYKDTFLRLIAQSDSRILQLLITVKHWAKARGICDSSRQFLNSYSFNLSVLHYLQHCSPALLPGFNLEHTKHKRSFDRSLKEQLDVFPKKNERNVGELLMGYFFYYGFAFDYDTHMISVKSGHRIAANPLTRTRKFKNGQVLFCIEDPLEEHQNPARSLNQLNLTKTRNEFMRSFLELAHGAKLKEVCQGFSNDGIPMSYSEHDFHKIAMMKKMHAPVPRVLNIALNGWYNYPIRRVLRHLRL
jgi:DNA polymerase sigma